jgi:hypothetical protein
MKKTIVPVSAKMAKSVKDMELELAKNILENKTPESQAELVDKIAKAKADMTKAHLKCIHTVQGLLSKEQFSTLLDLASNSAKAKDESAEKKANPQAEELFKAKCASCHTMTRPTDMSKLVAPAIMGVMKHVKMSYGDKDKAVAFMKDYVLNPSTDKSVCMPQKIKKFGVMPSQKGLVTEKELDTILPWLFDNFPPKGFKGMGMMK